MILDSRLNFVRGPSNESISKYCEMFFLFFCRTVKDEIFEGVFLQHCPDSFLRKGNQGSCVGGTAVELILEKMMSATRKQFIELLELHSYFSGAE